MKSKVLVVGDLNDCKHAFQKIDSDLIDSLVFATPEKDKDNKWFSDKIRININEVGSAEDSEFLRSVNEKIPEIDILIDNGGYTLNQQIVAFEELFPSLPSDGFICVKIC